MGQHETESAENAGGARDVEVAAPPADAAEPTPPRPGRAASRAVLALACTAQFMVVLDVSVVNVALPSIRSALGFDPDTLPWVVNAYALALACFLLLGGRLADLCGRRRVLVWGLALFGGASLVGGLATTPGTLIAARVGQGLGAAILAPVSLTLLTTTFPEGPDRTRALATWTAVGVAGGTAGNLVGGVLTQSLSWRWVLLVNVPIGVVALALTTRLPRDRERPRGRRLDVPGAVLATAGLAALSHGITQTRTRGWTDPVTVTALAVGIFALLAFVVVESWFARAPLVPPRLARVRAIAVGNLATALAGACLNPMWYFLTLLMQGELHYGPLWTGLGFLPHTVVAVVAGARLTPWAMARVDSRNLVALGALVAAAGFLWQSRTASSDGYLAGILGPAVVISVGSGLLNTPLTAAVTSGADPSDAGVVAGLMNTSKQVGGALGLAVLVAVAGSTGPDTPESAVDHGRAFLVIAGTLVAVAAISLALPRTRVTRRESGTTPAGKG
ncbi:drug resistance transporter, EmrB/QacA subfamily [Streptoalloteichus tenebrarius]|uniref:Drug resistance transporter, EmrB/QacA subfamily n=1 Tax=Streptoalloteichus tenebrarius (strain ATCC 17920 / DSM 40477 / JCM 4838 / CBS 697.72 / NBRC 16177 / NCIMB 11028 / NRRL B-12390 / A12253. 1 / ISP 5477) TaxID=1933 RepID=A0ABT1I1G2_STRSD|nr:MFS transporter [Streptoalloteichus tenebrarius]MCP2261604.1 drug resistance transporter, EmrB/QacA subfamily [Streptoalloteichus tenebrarius]BFE99394.1 MFS transporter [Streptoalloteichus tenebrarius]